MIQIMMILDKEQVIETVKFNQRNETITHGKNMCANHVQHANGYFIVSKTILSIK